MDTTLPDPPILLGVAERSLTRGPFVDLLGVSPFAVLPLFPQKLQQFVLVLALPRRWIETAGQCRIDVRDQRAPTNSAHVEFSWTQSSRNEGSGKIPLGPSRAIGRPSTERTDVHVVFAGSASHAFAVMPFPPLFIQRPGPVNVYWRPNGEEVEIGEVTFCFRPSKPLTPEERRAILSRPHAFRSAAIMLQCKACNRELSVFDRLDGETTVPEAFPDAVHKDAVPDKWHCDCKNVQVESKYFVSVFSALFRGERVQSGEGELALTPMYHKRLIRGIIEQYEQLIARDPREEEVQKFLQDHDMFWSFLSPERILHKPRILTHHTADFGVVTTHKTLWLVEIERPGARILTKKGEIHKDTRRALDQIRDWRAVVQKDWRALLSELDLQAEDVDRVEYMAVCGRASQEDPKLLSRFRAHPPDSVQFFAFDELVPFLLQMESMVAAM